MPGAPDPSGNAPHALQEIFRRRLTQQKSKYAPCLGWKEFLPSYFGPARMHDASASKSARLEEALTLALPAFLLTPWDAPTNGRYAPVFRELNIEAGILRFPAYRWMEGHFAFDGASRAA